MSKTRYDIYLSPPGLSGSELTYISEALQSNWITTEGRQVDLFEEELSRYIGTAHALLTNSGTSAIHLALAALGVGKDDLVICPSFTFVATVNPVLYQGAVPVFIDSEPETWNMDPQLLEEAIVSHIKKGKKPKAIIYVHIYGMPAKIEEIQHIAKKYEISLVEDAAEALGAKYKGEHVGKFGDISILSFNGNKIITTSGGGALLSNNNNLINRCRFLATQAREDFTHYEHKETGFNYRMSNVCAAIGRAQLICIDDRVKKRRENYNFYKKMLLPFEGFSLLDEPDERFSNRWLTCILLKDETLAPKILNALKENYIESRPLWKPMHLQPIFKDAYFYGANLSEQLFRSGLCLPSGSNLSSENLRKVCEIILTVL